MAKKEDEKFDLKKLMELSEPLTVYIERTVGNSTEPVALPALGRDRLPDPNGTPGSGWMRDDVVKLQPWVRDYWSGAGTYRVQVIDSNNKPFEYWMSIQADAVVKQRTPPPLGSPNIMPPSAIQQLVPAQHTPSPGVPAVVQPPAPSPLQGWGQPQQVPQGAWQMPQQPPPQTWGQSPPPAQFQQPVQGYGAPPGYGMPPGWAPGYGAPPQPWNPYAPPSPWGQPPTPTGGRDAETERALKQVQAELEESKRHAIELKYQQDLERQRQESQRQFDAMREEMRRQGEKDAGKENDEVRRAREDRERMERERENERRERERQEANQRFAELQTAILKVGEAKRPSEDDDRFRRLEEENRRRDEAHQRELEKRDQAAREERIRLEIKESNEKNERMMRELTAAQHKGPDPVIEMMKENAREARATQERIATMQAQQMTAMQSSSINPLQLVSILKDRDSGSDQFMRTMMPTLTGVIDLYRSAAENVVGLSGGGPAAAWQPIAEQVISTGKDVMERYFTWKHDSEVSGNKAKIAQAQSNAAAANAAAAAQAAVAQIQYQGPRPAANGVHAPAVGGLAGAETTAANGAQPAGDNVVPIRQPPGEAERFGIAYESVLKMRKAIKAGKLTPEQAIDAMLQGVNFVMKNNALHPPGDPEHKNVPVFTLYAEQRWADLVDQLIPGAPLPFKDECVRILSHELEPVKQGDPDVEV